MKGLIRPRKLNSEYVVIMEDETLIDVDGRHFRRSEAIYLIEKHWDKLPQDIQKELLLLGIIRNNIQTK